MKIPSPTIVRTNLNPEFKKFIIGKSFKGYAVSKSSRYLIHEYKDINGIIDDVKFIRNENPYLDTHEIELKISCSKTHDRFKRKFVCNTIYKLVDGSENVKIATKARIE